MDKRYLSISIIKYIAIEVDAQNAFEVKYSNCMASYEDAAVQIYMIITVLENDTFAKSIQIHNTYKEKYCLGKQNSFSNHSTSLFKLRLKNTR